MMADVCSNKYLQRRQAMEILDRTAAAKLLGMTPNALSCHIYRKNWSFIPRPIKVGGKNRWVREEIIDWLKARIEETKSKPARSSYQGEKRGPGRPPKKRRATC